MQHQEAPSGMGDEPGKLNPYSFLDGSANVASLPAGAYESCHLLSFLRLRAFSFLSKEGHAQPGFSFSELSAFKASSFPSTVPSLPGDNHKPPSSSATKSSVVKKMAHHPRLTSSAAKLPASKVPDTSSAL